jgi:CheY-like chemotaxis protein
MRLALNLGYLVLTVNSIPTASRDPMSVFVVGDSTNQHETVPTLVTPPLTLSRLRMETRGEHDALEQLLDLASADYGIGISSRHFDQALKMFKRLHGLEEYGGGLNSHGVDGREALVSIKTDPRLKEIPLVVMTTLANPKDVAFCYQAGANAYHVKPVRHDQYLLLLRSLLRYWLSSVTVHSTIVKVN